MSLLECFCGDRLGIVDDQNYILEWIKELGQWVCVWDEDGSGSNPSICCCNTHRFGSKTHINLIFLAKPNYIDSECVLLMSPISE